MKKTASSIALLAALTLILTSCLYSTPSGQGGQVTDQPPSITETKTREVTFVIDGESQTKTFDADEEIVYPSVPEKENYIFSGWYYDKEGKRPAALGSSNASSVTLYALWNYDYESAINSIFGTYIKAALSIEINHKKTSGFGFVTAAQKVSGSGVIFREDASYYYAFTNAHVTERLTGYNVMDISVFDCYGTEHSAAIVTSASEYDLAILKISKGEEPLEVLPLAEKSAAVDDVVIAIGTPEGLENSVTFGNVTKIAELSDDAAAGNLGFPVIWHDAPMDHGSSGGVLLNSNFEIVGINYAVGTKPENGEFLCGLAVDVEQINEFLAKQ